MNTLNFDFTADLHIHSTASDGNWSPEEIVTRAQSANVALISVTDHDTVFNAEAVCKAAEGKLKTVAGVEISSTLSGSLYHVLGYFIDIHNAQLNQLLNTNVTLEAENNQNRDDTCIRDLIRKGLPIDWEEYRKFGGGAQPVPGGQFHSGAIDFLISKGHCSDRKDFFQRVYPGGSPIGFPAFPHTQEAIRSIKKAGGFAILAHPIHRLNRLTLQETLALFTDMEIDGYECFHPNMNEADSEKCREWCLQNSLQVTGGSDCHGDRIRGRAVGNPKIALSQLFGRMFRNLQA